MALTKAEMAEALFNQLGLNKREARELVDLFFEEVRAALSGGEQVKLSGFGNFDLRDKNQRPGRNPKTGQEIPIDRKSTRLNSSHDQISYAVFCLKKKKKIGHDPRWQVLHRSDVAHQDRTSDSANG